MSAVPGLRQQEMHRHKERGFCCGAGGARMWMEERIGKRINNERVEEALSLNPDIVSTACPFCLVMLTDSVNGKKNDGKAKESVTVVDVAQLLLDSVKTPVDPEPAERPRRSRSRPRNGTAYGRNGRPARPVRGGRSYVPSLRGCHRSAAKERPSGGSGYVH